MKKAVERRCKNSVMRQFHQFHVIDLLHNDGYDCRQLMVRWYAARNRSYRSNERKLPPIIVNCSYRLNVRNSHVVDAEKGII